MDDAWCKVRCRAEAHGWRTRLRLWQRWTGTPFRVAGELLPREGTILDVGCGFGMLSGLLALDSPTRRVIGLDVDAAKIARAQRLFGDVATFRVADLDAARPDDLPLADAAVVWDVLHHLADPDALLRHLAGWLRPDGLVVVKENDTEPLGKRAIAELVEVLAVGLDVTASAPVRFRSRAEWARSLTEAGFTVRRAEHLPAREGFFVPHSLFVAERTGAP